jgi:hypothetical protein
MKNELCPCKRCGRIPIVKVINDLFYVQCPVAPYTNHKGVVVKCDKWQPYEFLGITETAAIHNWYWANTKKVLDEEV